MADYNSNLKTWGANGSEYPNGYSYLEGEQPIDDWDNFIRYNSIEDLGHLIDLTNKRIESVSGTSHPTSPEVAQLSYRTDNERLYHYNSTASSWHGLLKVDGDTLQGTLDVDGHTLKNVGKLKLDGETDVSGNDVKDTVNGSTMYDGTAGHVPLAILEQSQVTVNAGSHLSGGESISLGGSITLNVEDDFLLKNGDAMRGELRGQRAENSRLFTAENTTSGDRLSIRADSSGVFQLVGYDSSDGTWDYNSALTYDPGTNDWEFGGIPSVDGDLIATRTWANSNADVPNADYADNSGKLNGSSLSDVKNWVNTSSDVPNADHADNSDYATSAGDSNTVGGLDPAEVNHFSTEANISVNAGQFAVADDTGSLYFEDGN